MIDEQKAEPQPHPSASHNFEHLKTLLKVYEFQGTIETGHIEYVICDYDVYTSMIKKLKYVGIYGEHVGSKWGRNISFHQTAQDFEKEIGEVLGWLEQNGYVKRKDRREASTLTPTEKHRKQAYTFGRQHPQKDDPFRCIIPNMEFVEVVNGTKKWQIRYDVSDADWNRQTGWAI